MTDLDPQPPGRFHSLPWPRPSLTVVMLVSESSLDESARSSLRRLSQEEGVEVIGVDEDRQSGGEDSGPLEDETAVGVANRDASLRFKGVIRATGHVIVFREVDPESGPSLGLPHLWEEAASSPSDLSARLRSAGVPNPSQSDQHA